VVFRNSKRMTEPFVIEADEPRGHRRNAERVPGT
jgi:hypothetical protein